MTFKLRTWDARVEKDFIVVNVLLSLFFMERDGVVIFSCLVANPFDNSLMSQYFTSLCSTTCDPSSSATLSLI